MGVEARIRELRDRGELTGLPGEGQPLPPDPDDGAGAAWAGRHVLRTSDARPLWTELRREITERRMRIVTRLRGHLAWLERRKALLEHLPAERIVAEPRKIAPTTLAKRGGRLSSIGPSPMRG